MMKYVAVVSAVVLVGGYVFLKSGGGGLMSSSKSGRIAYPPDVDEADSPNTAPTTQPGFRLRNSLPADFAVMSSSKSGPVAEPAMFDRDELTLQTTQPTTSPTTIPAK